MEHARPTLGAQVLDRAAKDPQFREQLRQDRRGTVSQDSGVQVPDGIAVEVLADTPSMAYPVLPPMPT